MATYSKTVSNRLSHNQEDQTESQASSTHNHG